MCVLFCGFYRAANRGSERKDTLHVPFTAIRVCSMSMVCLGS